MFADLDHELQRVLTPPPPTPLYNLLSGIFTSNGQTSNRRSLHDDTSPMSRGATRSSSPEAIMTEPHHHHPMPDDAVFGSSSNTTTSVSRRFSDLDSTTFVLWAGALCAARTAVQHPLNLALTRKQTCPTAASMSTFAIVKGILGKEGGWRHGLCQGMLPLVAGCAISESLYLVMYEWSREKLPLESTVKKDTVGAYFSDVACRVVHLPLSIIAYRQMTSSSSFTANSGEALRSSSRMNVRATCRSIYAEQGLRSLFAGFGATLLIGCQWTAVWWAMYNQTKMSLYHHLDPFLHDIHTCSSASNATWVRRWFLSRGDNTAINSIASVATSAFTAVMFNPFLVVVRRLQTTRGGVSASATVKSIYQQSGPKGFYAGTMLSVVCCTVDGILASTSYEYAKLWSDVSPSS